MDLALLFLGQLLGQVPAYSAPKGHLYTLAISGARGLVVSPGI